MEGLNRRGDRSEVRVKFKDFVLQHLPDTLCSARVVLASPTGEEFVGTADGEDSAEGQLRTAAQATAHALEAVAHGQVELTVLAAKALRTLETVLVVVALASRADQRSERLVGSCLIKDQPARGAVLAVLDATNRLFSVYLQ